MKKNVIIALVISVLVVIVLGVSFAYFTPQILEGNIFSTTGTAKDNSANITLTGDAGINLTNAYPMTDEEGLATDPYTFTITNNETDSYISYQIVIETKDTNTLRDDLVSTNLGGNLAFTRTMSSTVGYSNGRIIYNGFLAPDASKTFDLKIWINERGTIDNAQNKTWTGKIVVKGTKEKDNSAATMAALNLDYLNGLVRHSSFAENNQYYLDNDFSKSITRNMTSSQDRYYAYSDTYIKNKETFTLVNPKIGKYSEIYNELPGKYITTLGGATSTNVIRTNASTCFKVESATSAQLVFGTYANTEYLVKDVPKSLIYSIEDDYGKSYYYVGNVSNNYVKFGKWASSTPNIYYGYYSTSEGSNFKEFSTLAECQADSRYKNNCELISRANSDMYWRIIRINGDGSIRIQYDGTSAHANGEMSVDRLVGSSAFNNGRNDNTYLGYMYGTVGANSYNDTHANTNDSAIKTYLDNWYKNNLLNSYNSYISDEVFCNDRSISNSSDIINSQYYNFTQLGYGAENTGYNTLGKYMNLDTYNSILPTLNNIKCPQKHDAFTMSDTAHGNGDLSYPVGLINADEAYISGLYFSDGNSKNNYLFKGKNYLTMSILYYETSLATVGNAVISSYYASLIDSDVTDIIGVAPVINLSPATAKTLIGTGTMTDPYRLP